MESGIMDRRRKRGEEEENKKGKGERGVAEGTYDENK